MFCKICGKRIEDGSKFCPQCEICLESSTIRSENSAIKKDISVSSKSRLAALLLAFSLGQFGIHNFYLGHVGRGISKIVMIIFGLFLLIFELVIISIETYSNSYSIDSFITEFDFSLAGLFFLGLFLLGLLFLFIPYIWSFVECILIACGQSHDSKGLSVKKW